jgi:hypothetical protein
VGNDKDMSSKSDPPGGGAGPAITQRPDLAGRVITPGVPLRVKMKIVDAGTLYLKSNTLMCDNVGSIPWLTALTFAGWPSRFHC